MTEAEVNPSMLSVDEKRQKIKSNYETIEVLKGKLIESKNQGRAGMSRASYVKMIVDATKRLERQNEELSKAIIDVRHLQRDISNLYGRLERSFTLVEEHILQVSIDIQ